MTDQEIIKSYKNAVNPKEQVNILCQLTLKPREEIVRILEEGGCKVEPEKKQPSKVPAEIVEKIRQMRENGATFKEIQRETGCGVGTIAKYIRAADSTPLPTPDAEPERILAPTSALERTLKLYADALAMLRKFAKASGNMEFWYSSDRYSFELVIEKGFMRMEVSEKLEENSHD